jgi:hypothetical protein
VLGEFGFSTGEIDALLERGCIQQLHRTAQAAPVH